jgi:hypothetical protein
MGGNTMSLFSCRINKWLFPQEKATFNAIEKSICISKMLWSGTTVGVA